MRMPKGGMAVLFATALVAASCAGGGSDAGPTSTVPTTQSPTTQSPVTQSPATTDPSDGDSTDAVDEPIDIEAVLAQDPLVIFNAFPPKPAHIEYTLPPGHRDFFELWEPDAPWPTALGHVDVYRIHAFQMRHFLSDEQIVTIVEFLREHDIPLMFETEPLQPPDPDECNHSESFEGPYDLEMAQRLKDLGGHIDVIAIEQPYHYGHKLDIEGACQYPLERIIDEVRQHVDGLRAIFGDIPVGTIEGVWAEPPTEPRDMEIWLDTWEAATGEPFAFLHLDPNWNWQNWSEVAAGIEAVADARGVPFGVLYNGGSETDGAMWMNAMMANAAELEMEQGATPQHVSFQSWNALPDHTLPETDLTALTSGIVRYFGERVELSARQTADGVLVTATTTDGRPLEGVVLQARRDGSSDTVVTQTVTGVTPAGAEEALILIRANAEDATRGAVDVVLHEISLTDGAGGANVVPNGDFAGGVDRWGVYGTDPRGVAAVAAGTGRGLAIRTSTENDIYVDGRIFSVTGGEPYRFEVTYELGAGDDDSVVVSIEFSGISRTNVLIRELPSDIGEFVTAADGTVLIPGDLLTSPARVEVATEGNLEHWPAVVSIDLR